MTDVIVIVGSGGMGVAIAHRLGSGRTLVLADLNSQNLNTATHALAANGHDVHGITVDVTSPSSVGDLAAYAAGLGTGHRCRPYRGRFTRVGRRRHGPSRRHP
jgi:NAD(P)-dependent dehydrogenase (short-subunit alcohol dehydrogenase family)